MSPSPRRPLCLDMPTGSTLPCPSRPRPLPSWYPILDIILCANEEYCPGRSALCGGEGGAADAAAPATALPLLLANTPAAPAV